MRAYRWRVGSSPTTELTEAEQNEWEQASVFDVECLRKAFRKQAAGSRPSED